MKLDIYIFCYAVKPEEHFFRVFIYGKKRQRKNYMGKLTFFCRCDGNVLYSIMPGGEGNLKKKVALSLQGIPIALLNRIFKHGKQL